MIRLFSRFVYAALMAILVVAPNVTLAEEGPGPLSYRGYATGIAALALSSDRVSNSMNVGGYNSLQITANIVDADAGITSIDVTCETSWDGSTRWGWITAKNLDGTTGISASKKYTDRLPNTGSTTYVSTWAINAQYMRCTFHANGVVTAVDDVITVDIRAAAQ